MYQSKLLKTNQNDDAYQNQHISGDWRGLVQKLQNCKVQTKTPKLLQAYILGSCTHTPISRQCQKKCMCLFPPPRPFLPQLFLLQAAFSCSAVNHFHCVKNIVQVAPCSGMCERLERQMGRQMYNAT